MSDIVQVIAGIGVCRTGETTVGLHNYTTGNSITLELDEPKYQLLIDHLHQRGRSGAANIQDALPFMTPFERDFILLGMSRHAWERLYYDPESSANDGDGNPSAVRFKPTGVGYDCLSSDGVGYGLGILINPTRTGVHLKWLFRSQHHVSLSEDQMFSLASKMKQLNAQST